MNTPVWLRLASWFNRRALKERALVFGAALLVVVGVLYSTKFAPLLEKQRALRAEIAQKESEVSGLMVQVAELSRVDRDPDRDLKARRDELKRLIAEAESGLKKKRDRTVGPDRIAQVLEDVLSRQEKVELVELKTLPPEPLFNEEQVDGGKKEQGKTPAPAAAEKPQNSPKSRSDAIQGIYRHGVQITVRGEYLDLLRYLNGIERLPAQFFWKDMEVQIAEYPEAVMRITVYTISFNRAWLSV